MHDSPSLYQYLVEANRFEEANQNHLADRTQVTAGLEAILRGLWRGRGRFHREESAKQPGTNKQTGTLED